MAKHISGTVCPSCEEKVASADHRLQDWFDKVKAEFPDVHISWAYRDEANQNAAFKAGESRLKWPMSAHNKMPSMAIDLFQQDSNGQGKWDPVVNAEIYNKLGQGLKWGGLFKTLGDSGHFELSPDELPN